MIIQIVNRCSPHTTYLAIIQTVTRCLAFIHTVNQWTQHTTCLGIIRTVNQWSPHTTCPGDHSNSQPMISPPPLLFDINHIPTCWRRPILGVIFYPSLNLLCHSKIGKYCYFQTFAEKFLYDLDGFFLNRTDNFRFIFPQCSLLKKEGVKKSTWKNAVDAES